MKVQYALRPGARIRILVITMVASFFAVWLGSRVRQHSPESLLTQEVGSRVSKAIFEKAELNLSNMDVVEWDEFFVVLPYQNSGHLPFAYHGPLVSSQDDGELFLVFLKQSKFIGKVLVDRSKVDFSRCSIANCTGSIGSIAERQQNGECRCPQKITRSQANFDVDHSMESFRALKLKSTQSAQ